MKKLLVVALGLGMALGTVSFAAQADSSATNAPKKAKKAKKAKKSKHNADKKM